MPENIFQFELYDFHKEDFLKATGKNAEENQQLYLSYLSCVYSREVLKELRELKEKLQEQ